MIAFRPLTALTAAAVALTLAGCSSHAARSGVDRTTLPPGGDVVAACETGRPQDIDRSEAADGRRPTWLLVLDRSGGDDASVAAQVLYDASLAGAELLVRGAGVPAGPPLSLMGEGNNPSARHLSRCDRLAAGQRTLDAALAGAEPAPTDLPAALASGFDEAFGLPGRTRADEGDRPDTVVVIGSAAGSTSVPLSQEALENPDATIEALREAKLLRDCPHWRFGFVTPTADARGEGVAERELWRRYARTCGGRLVSWAPAYGGVGSTELPPAASPRREAVSTTQAVGRTTVHVLSASALFPINSATLSPAAVEALQAVLAQAGRATRIDVVGHSDATSVPGDPDFNVRISRSRAAAVAAYLSRSLPAGVPIHVTGLGASRPVAPDTEGERYRNRRVEITVHH